MADTLFGDTPLYGSYGDGSPGLTLRTRIRVLTAGTITAVRWPTPSTLPGASPQWQLDGYDPGTDSSTGTLDSGTFGAPSAGFYRSACSVPVQVGDELAVQVWTPDWYVAASAYFGVDRYSSGGNLLGPADDWLSTPTHRNGAFAVGNALAFPTSGYPPTTVGSSYLVDVEWEPAPTGLAPDGIAAAAQPGVPAAEATSVAEPTGRGTPVGAGTPNTTWSTAVTPGGAPAPTPAGNPTADTAATGVPAGVGVTTTPGTPSGRWAATTSPAGFAVAAVAGTPTARWSDSEPSPAVRVRVGRLASRFSTGEPRPRWNLGEVTT